MLTQHGSTWHPHTRNRSRQFRTAHHRPPSQPKCATRHPDPPEVSTPLAALRACGGCESLTPTAGAKSHLKGGPDRAARGVPAPRPLDDHRGPRATASLRPATAEQCIGARPHDRRAAGGRSSVADCRWRTAGDDGGAAHDHVAAAGPATGTRAKGQSSSGCWVISRTPTKEGPRRRRPIETEPGVIAEAASRRRPPSPWVCR